MQMRIEIASARYGRIESDGPSGWANAHCQNFPIGFAKACRDNGRVSSNNPSGSDYWAA